MFLTTLADQQALTYKIATRNKVLSAGTKVVDEWTPTASGVGALTAPQTLEANLAALKADLLANAPSELALKAASADLDTHLVSFLDRGRKIAQDGLRARSNPPTTNG